MFAAANVGVSTLKSIVMLMTVGQEIRIRLRPFKKPRLVLYAAHPVFGLLQHKFRDATVTGR